MLIPLLTYLMQIHLATAFDQNYLTPFYVLITSIFQNNKYSTFHIHTIATGITELEKEEIRQFVLKNKSEISFYNISEIDLKGLVLPENRHYTIAIYYRLFFPSLIPKHIQKLLYIDTDIVVVGNIAELYAIDLNGFPAAAVPELNTPVKTHPQLGIVEEGNYFNSGVLLINIWEWKNQRITEKAIQFVHANPELLVFPDQDALNTTLYKNYKKLDNRYNIIPFDIPGDLSKRQYNSFLKDKVIIHYTLSVHKPWKFTSVNKFRYLYHQYKELSPKANEKKYTDFNLNRRSVTKYLKIRATENLLNYPILLKTVQTVFGNE